MELLRRVSAKRVTMFAKSPQFYDAIYGALKDYRREAEAVASRLRQVNSGCKAILDVGCGTGEHARLLAEQGFHVDGLGLDGDLLEIARKKHPAGRFLQLDMSDFTSETHELGLFTAEELMTMFHAAGLRVDYDSKGLSNRGLYVAVKAA